MDPHGFGQTSIDDKKIGKWKRDRKPSLGLDVVAVFLSVSSDSDLPPWNETKSRSALGVRLECAWPKQGVCWDEVGRCLAEDKCSRVCAASPRSKSKGFI